MQFEVPDSPKYYTKDLAEFLGVDFTSIAPNEHRASNLINLVNNDGYLETRPGYDEVSSFGIQATGTQESTRGTLEFTAIRKGVAGNDITVSFVKPTKARQKLKLTEEDGQVVYTLATDNSGEISTTYQDIINMPNHYVTFECDFEEALVEEADFLPLTGGENHHVNGIWNYDEGSTNVFIAYVETKLYKLDSNFENPVELLSGLPDTTPDAVFTDNTLCLFNGTRAIAYGFFNNMYTAVYMDTVGYIPTTSVNRKPAGTAASSQYYESPNLISLYRINSFVSDGVSTTYYVEGPYDNEEPIVRVLTSTGEMVQYQVASYNNTAGTVTLVSAPPLFDVTGRDSVFITFKMTPKDGNPAPLINKCTIATMYGYNANANRIFVSGNPDYPNVDWFSGMDADGGQPLYFPDDNFTQIGTQPIVAYSKLNDGTLAVQKATSDTDYTCYYRTSALYNSNEVFPIRMGTKVLGCITRHCNANLVNDPMTLTEMGVYGIKGSSYGEKFQVERSYFVKKKLLEEPNLKNAVAIVFNNRYYLAINNHVYVADARFKSKVNQVSGNDYQYEWYYWDNIPVKGFFTYNDELYFYTETGDICKFNDTCLDYNFPIKCLFDTAFLDLGTLTYAKTVKRVTVVTRPFEDSEYLLSYETVDGEENIIDKDTSSGPFLSTLQEKEKIKKLMFVKFRLTNDTPKKMNFYRLAILYIIAGRYRGD